MEHLTGKQLTNKLHVPKSMMDDIKPNTMLIMLWELVEIIPHQAVGCPAHAVK
jgi:hypothetical protein